MKSFCVLCGRWMLIPAEKPVPIICSVCEMSDVLEEAVVEGSVLIIPEKEEEEKSSDDSPEI